VVPCVAGAQQGLKGSGLRGRVGYPGELWDRSRLGPAQTGGGDPDGCGSSGTVEWRVPTVCGSGMGL
jgi:hypothetical protein